MAATYFNGLAIASVAVGGIGQAVASGAGTLPFGILGMLGWYLISIVLPLAAQVILRKAPGMSDAQFNFTIVGPLMFAAAGAVVYLVTWWMDRRSRRDEVSRSRQG